ncbi:DUF3363 domain-containing protein [Phenylobacterium sp. LH3H17]|uniref:DUF3363 domain-containing protein n=1 Tax=Phenylobacterium sp. LH3H17 TaxID=2903901 RepID=UPI0020C94639|nr:DUF3363 domain-containing protein [Phenylobacterium sp. LH3H17]UTP38164.1 DUF3363 domain-containing protein [Phenylobacterium sp. LH3H17]
MLVREVVERGLEAYEGDGAAAARVSLPRSVKAEGVDVRTGLFRRLAASRHFALGDRSGVLSAAQRRSGRAFRLDVRQRVVVKALVSRHIGVGVARGAALARHVSYLGRGGAGLEGARPGYFDQSEDVLDPSDRTRDWTGDRHHFRFIISPEHGDRIADLRGYVREAMGSVAADLGEPDLNWIGTCHFDTDQPHAHVLVRGLRMNGRDLVIPRDYIAFGFRARAQEAAQARLGDLSRADAERRVWRETEADRFTGLDRRLLASARADGSVDDGVGLSEAWAALTRGRLRHLERIGLAQRAGARYRLPPDLEARLRSLQMRKDVIRTLNQRRLEAGHDIREFGVVPVRGRVVKSGAHDELGAAAFVIVRDRDGIEHYARLGFGAAAPAAGQDVQFARNGRGVAALSAGRGIADRGL